jgi:hypothetical protein
MSELISIREAARRLGVSDTAVHKAIKAGRVSVAGKTDSGRPLMDWSDTGRRWLVNSDASKRSHVGSRGSPVRAQDAPRVDLPTSNRMDEGATAGGEPGTGMRGGSYAQARAAREVFQAKLAKLEYEERTGKLIDADQAKVAWYKHITAAKTRIMGIPAACKSRYSDLPLAVVATIEAVCREALEDLANGGG